MRRIFVVAAAMAAAVTVAGASPPAGAKDAPLLGVVWRFSASQQEKLGRLVRIDPQSLRPLRVRHGVVVGKTADSWAWSPDHSMVVVSRWIEARDQTVLRFIDANKLRFRGDLNLGARGGELLWSAPDRLLALGASGVTVIDPVARTVLARTDVPYVGLGRARWNNALVILGTPPNAIGPPHLVVIDANGAKRSVLLGRITAGFVPPPGDDDDPTHFRHRVPGLAIDADGGRAFVVGDGEPVAEVDLGTLAVRYHDVSRAASGRQAYTPARLVKQANGNWRQARWLGNGMLAVTGTDAAPYTDASGRTQVRRTPAGLRFIDTRTWSARVVDAGADDVLVSGDVLLATGQTWDGGSQTGSSIGLVGYSREGSARFRLFRGAPTGVWLAYGDRAYVASGGAMKVVNITSGRVLGRRDAELPWLLIGDSSFDP